MREYGSTWRVRGGMDVAWGPPRRCLIYCLTIEAPLGSRKIGSWSLTERLSSSTFCIRRVITLRRPLMRHIPSKCWPVKGLVARKEGLSRPIPWRNLPGEIHRRQRKVMAAVFSIPHLKAFKFLTQFQITAPKASAQWHTRQFCHLTLGLARTEVERRNCNW